MNKWESQIDQLWMFFMTLFLCSLYFEQKLFDKAFKSTNSYVFIVVGWFLVLYLMYSFGKKISSQTIRNILTICSISVSLVWLYYAAALPSLDFSEAKCTTWDCHLLQQLAMGSMVDSWATSTFGQSIMILCQFTIIPTLLMILIQRNLIHERNQMNNSGSALLILGVGLLLIGLFEVFLPSFVTMICISLLNFIFAMMLSQFPIISKNHNGTKFDQVITNGSYIQLNFLYFIQNLFMLAGIVVFVFSFVNVDSYIFERLWEMSIGVFFIYLWNRKVLPHFSKDINQQRWWQDFFFYTSLVVTMAMGWNFYNSNSELVTNSGISPIISGLFYGYFSIWLNDYLKNPNPNLSRSISLKLFKKPVGDLFLLNMIIMLIFVGTLFEINPRSNDGFITFLPGLIVAIIGWLIVISRKFIRSSA